MLARSLSSVLLTALTVVAPGAGSGTEVSAQPWGYLITGKQVPRPGAAAARSGGSRVTCAYTPWFADGRRNGGLEFVDPGSNPAQEPADEGAYYLVECSDGYRDVIWIRGSLGPRITPEQLAQQAYALIPIRPPKVLTAPPRGDAGLVGLAQWFYLAKSEWVAKSKRLRVGAVWAEATATPSKMTVMTGDGETITCDGPGTAYDRAKRADQQRSTCSYRYPHPARAYQVTVRVTWSGSWRGSGGTGGVLSPITRSVTFSVRIAEAQALVMKG